MNVERKPVFGSYLVIPLKYDGEFATAAAELAHEPLTTMDLTENVKAMLSGEGDSAVGRCCRIEAERIRDCLTEGKQGALSIRCDSGTHPFEICTGWLYVFRTQVAFLCLGIRYEHMDVINTLTGTGHADNKVSVLLTGEKGTGEIDLEARLRAFCQSLGLRKFFDGPSSVLLEAYACTLGVFPKYFQTMEELRRITFRLHQMIPLESAMDDGSEEDTSFVYAVKSEEEAAYRWGYCVASQKLSYAVANKGMDFPSEMRDFAADALPIVLLMLQQKYTCLRFTELIAQRKKPQELTRLKRMMLEFKAFGTVTPANLSRWHNIKQIYAHLLEANDVVSAVDDISTKLSILTEEQETIEAKRTDRMSNIITVFGLISILDSVISIVSALKEGDPILWHCSTATASAVLVLLLLASRSKKQ